MGTLHFSETNFEPLAASSRDFIEQKVNFGPKVPNLPYKVLLLNSSETWHETE